MTDNERDETPMLLESKQQLSDEYEDPRFRALSSRTRSASFSVPANSAGSYENSSHLVGYTGPLRSERKGMFSPMSGPLYPRPDNLPPVNQGGGSRKVIELSKQKFPSFCVRDQNDPAGDNYAAKNSHLLRSGQLGLCNDPYCTTCPTYYRKAPQQRTSKSSGILDPFHHSFYGDARGWAKRFSSYIVRHIPGVMNPHAKVVQRWNKFFVISCLIAVFFDPMFFFLLTVDSKNMCIVLNRPMTTTIVVFRSVTDFVYLLHILLQFRLAYIAPESRVFGAGDLEDDPKKIALNYLSGYFSLDVFIALPLPQIMILMVLPQFKGSAAANYAKNLLRTAVLVQYIPRLYRFLPLLAGQSTTGFIFESAWANFVINLLTFVLSGHVVGSSWYLFGLQRVNQCLRNACHPDMCIYMDCGDGDKIKHFSSNTTMKNGWNSWKNNATAASCFTEDGFSYGIYVRAVNLTTQESVVTRYVYSLFWGFQYSGWKSNPKLFRVGSSIYYGHHWIGPLALLIGNMQNFLQALGRRRLELSLRRRDIEQWMSHRRLSDELRRRVRQAERYNWAATRGVHEEMLLENLPEDLQRDIRRHLFKFVKEIWIFKLLEDPIFDAICEKLRQKTFIKGSTILNRDDLFERMIFIVRGKMESDGEDGITELSEGHVCGEELLAWCLENSSVNKEGKKIRAPGQRLHSNRTVKCLTNVEAFALRAADLEEVTRHFPRSLRSPRVQGAIRYLSPYWRGLAATRIQVAWRYRKKCLTRANTSQSLNGSRQNVVYGGCL